MKKALLIFVSVALAFLSNAQTSQISPAKIVRVPTATTVFNDNISPGTIIVNDATAKQYKVLIPILGTYSISSCSISQLKQMGTVIRVIPGFGLKGDTVTFDGTLLIDTTVVLKKSTAASIYEPKFSKNTAFNKNFGTSPGTVLEGRTFGTAANSAITDFEPAITKSAGYAKWTGSAWSFANEDYSLTSHNHDAAYRPIGYVTAWSEITSNPFSFTTPANGQLILYNSTSAKWENWTPNFLTSFTETDPVFNAHTVKTIANGTGFLRNNGTGTWSYDNSSYLSGSGTNGQFALWGSSGITSNSALTYSPSIGSIGVGAPAGNSALVTIHNAGTETPYGLFVTNGSSSTTLATENSGNYNTYVTGIKILGSVSDNYFVMAGGGILAKSAYSAFPGFGTTNTTAAYGDHTHGTYVPYSGATGNVSLNTGTTYYTITASNFILSSDFRLKNRIQQLNFYDFGRVGRIEFRKFFMNCSPFEQRYGVIAQEVEKVAPEFVRTDEYGIKSVAYIDLLVAKIAQMDEKIKELENQIKKLRK